MMPSADVASIEGFAVSETVEKSKDPAGSPASLQKAASLVSSRQVVHGQDDGADDVHGSVSVRNSGSLSSSVLESEMR